MIVYHLREVDCGKSTPEIVNAIIEIPEGSQIKYELDKKSVLLKLNRVLFSAVYYPANYDFIPQTFCDDGVPLDILVICLAKVDPLCIIESKVIGFMGIIYGEEEDDKIIAVAKNDMSVNYINNLNQLPPHTTVQLKRFFEDYKKLEHKNVVVEQFFEKDEAYRVINNSIELYKKKFRNHSA